MSDDNVYEFNDNEQSAFDIPESSTVDEQSKSEEQEQTSQENTSANEEEATPSAEEKEEEEDDNEDDEYDPSAPDTKENEEGETEESKTADEDEDNLYASADEDAEAQSESAKPQEQSKVVTQSTPKVPKEKKKVTFQVPEKEESNDDGNNDDDDQEDEEEDDDDYDPTAEVSDASVNTSSTPSSSTSQTSTSTSGDNNLQSYASKIMSSNLLSDPEFLKLSDSEKQQRILEELKSPTQSNDTQLHSSYTPSSVPQLPLNASTGFGSGAGRPNLRIPMSNEEIGKYNAFVDNEAKYATSRHTPAPNSRLFVGNLPSNSISKQDLFRLFSRYGTILQISLKGSYGFIQYTDASAVEKAIENESKEPLNGKDLMLQIAKNSKVGSNSDGGHGGFGEQNDRKRGREDYYDHSSSNTRRRKDLECKILVKKNADAGFTKDVNRQFHAANIHSEYEFLKPHMVLKEKTNEAAYGGCIGVVLINRNRTCDVQTYEKTFDGSIKFDEFLNVTPQEATGLLLRAKQNQYNNNGGSNRSSYGGQPQGGYQPQQQQAPSFGQQPNFYQPQQQQPAPPAMDTQQQLLQTLSTLPPNALQSLMALAQGQQQPQQQQQPAFQNPYQQFQQPQQQQPAPAANPALNLASLLGQVAQQPQQPQFPYGNTNSYQQPQAPTPQFSQPQSAPTQSPPQNQAQPGGSSLSIQDLMANLQKYK